MKERKENGIYYTPSVLAEYLANPLISFNEQSVLDPAYGEGALLLAAEKIFKEKNIGNSINLFGCDIKPVNGLLGHLPQANLLKTDFFEYSTENKFYTILMNPPYVRHHIQDRKKISKYKELYKELNVINNNSDLWALFIVKALLHLLKGGSIGAILPWAFLQADYSSPLRKLLSEKFKEIEIIALSDKYFKNADERIVVAWFKEYGCKNISINIAATNRLVPKIKYSKISVDSWVADRVTHIEENVLSDTFNLLETKYGFTKLSEHADIKIGVVSGAVDYFIISRDEAKKFNFPQNRLTPILTKADEFPKYIVEGKKNLKNLLVLKKNDHLIFRKYIKIGKEKKYDLRSHSVLREPWYVVNVGKIPDAFFHYRISMIPYLLPNCKGVQCTNAFHRVYFKNLTRTEMKWIYVSILSSFAQLSVEINSKTYGRGILKIEPKSLKNTLVIKRNDPKINGIYDEIIKFLSQDKKEMATIFANEFLSKELKISKDLALTTNNMIETLRNLRQSNKITQK